jgi:site-specific recombinase XerD
MPAHAPKLLDQVRQALRVMHYAIRTEEAYTHWIKLMAKLMYSSGLRLMECVRLRVKDVDFAQRQIIIRSGKGNKDRDTLLPGSLSAPSSASFTMPRPSIRTISNKAMGMSICRMRWRASIPLPIASGVGSMSSQQIGCPLIRALE